MKLVRISLIGLLIITHNYCFSNWAEETLNNFSVDEKIGQLFMIPARADSSLYAQDNVVSSNHMIKSYKHMHQDYVDYLIRHYHVGGIIYLGKHTVPEQQTLTKRFQSSTNIPLLIGQDFEWGLAMRLTDCSPFPRAMAIGTLDEPSLTYQMGYTIGNQCRQLGVHINFAPVVDINTNPNNPIIGTRSFGDTKEQVINHATAYAQGLFDAGILPCIKHFPGHGDTIVDSHVSLPLITHNRMRLEHIELAPFQALIQKNIPAVMIAHLSVPTLDATGTPASLSRIIVTDLLRTTYQFDGLIITDGLDMKALTNTMNPAHIALQALIAGNDILLAPSDVPGACALIKKALDEQTISMSELDGHVLRILRAKEWLFYTQGHSPNPQPTSLEALHPPQVLILQQNMYTQLDRYQRKEPFPLTINKKTSQSWF